VVTKRATELRIVGGDPALDLANTLEGEHSPDSLADYAELAAWAAKIGVIDAAGAGRLAARGRERPAEAARVLAEARALRTEVDAVFRPLATGDEPPEEALAAVLARGADAAARARLVRAHDPAALGRSGGAFGLAWDGDDLERVVWPLAAAAVDLLRTGPLDRLKQCAHCPWLFLDSSRNRSRRWCTMSECGANAKMRRYRARLATAGR
jgi:predicted RNA-binding Zn ribbon-like protein